MSSVISYKLASSNSVNSIFSFFKFFLIILSANTIVRYEP